MLIKNPLHRISPSPISPISHAKLHQVFNMSPAPTIADVLISYEKAENYKSLQENEKFAAAIVKRYGHIHHIVWCRNLCTGF